MCHITHRRNSETQACYTSTLVIRIKKESLSPFWEKNGQNRIPFIQHWWKLAKGFFRRQFIIISIPLDEDVGLYLKKKTWIPSTKDNVWYFWLKSAQYFWRIRLNKCIFTMLLLCLFLRYRRLQCWFLCTVYLHWRQRKWS